MSSEVLNKSAPRGISVLISGAGIGGLTAALEFWRRGCDVRILERTGASSTLGDSIGIGPTAAGIFKNWPWLERKNEDLAYSPMISYHNIKGDCVIEPSDFDLPMSAASGNQKRIYRHSRPKFHAVLLEQLAMIDVHVEYNMEVVDYYENMDRSKAGVVVKDGSRHEADLVIAADGLRGKSSSIVTQNPVPARNSGHAIMRVAYPVERALSDPMVAERFKLLDNGRSVLELWMGPGMHAFFWRNEDEMQWMIYHPDNGTAEESWANKITPEEVLKFTATIPDWPEVANRAIKTAPPDKIVDWKLMWRDPQPTWTSAGGRVVQLGDAAHSFLPTSGNGGTQAMEDAISLAACVVKAGSKNELPDATRVHNVLRFERVSCLQAMGVSNEEKRHAYSKSKDPTNVRTRFGKWITEHDPEQYAFDNYNEALLHLQSGTPFHNTNTPPGMVYMPWTIDGLIEAQRRGEPTVLDGNWD